jgi:hypothetical protein
MAFDGNLVAGLKGVARPSYALKPVRPLRLKTPLDRVARVVADKQLNPAVRIDILEFLDRADELDFLLWSNIAAEW